MSNVNPHLTQNKSVCEKHMNRYVVIQTNDGQYHDGIVESVDDENVYLAIPHCPGDERAFFPYGGYGYGGYYPRRRFYRRGFPLGGLLALSLLPFFI
ncbi:hypothetical protein [Paenibacillus paeoniae]|uniref:Phosphatidylinositol kinase n=1 Tax=Paenibacillus paeoniae TaxID=2292705 RepID=A0A371PMI7_9BACL|nr:hypothetical protein [Paenibacillus paeoniae]REK77412.1 hypothetical protein DX130_10565 [Paenibacillus paeoniae]